MSLSNAELAYLGTQRLGRLATAQPDGTLQVNPVGFRYNHRAGTIDIGGFNMASSRQRPGGLRGGRHRLDRPVAGALPGNPRAR
jgi:pyridoxamine 5'-phosphate oxidase family protein